MRAHAFASALLALPLAVVLGIGVPACAPAPAEAATSTTWSEFHYAPTLSGYNPWEGVLNSGNAHRLVTKWHRVLGDNIQGTPLVARSRVIALGLSGKLYALDPASGRSLWTVKASAEITSTPAIWGSLVITPTRDTSGGFVSAYSVTSGSRQWRTRVSTDKYVWLTPPTIYGGRVYLSNGSEVLALSASGGKVLWRRTVSSAQEGYVTGPVAISGGGEFAIAAGLDGQVYALDGMTGALRWQARAGGGTYHGSAAISGGVAFIAEGSGGAEGGGFDIFALQVADGRLLWHAYAGDDVHITPAAGAGMVVIGSIDEGILARDIRTGALRWSTPYEGEVWGAAVIANGVIYAATDQQLVVHSAATGAPLWSNKIVEHGAAWSSPAVVNGRVYMGGDDGVWSFGLP